MFSSIVLMLPACGSGDHFAPINDSPSFSILNPGLSGKLFFKQGRKGFVTSNGKEFSAWTMDIGTGKYSKIPNTDWDNHEDRFPGSWTSLRATPVDHDNSEFIVEIPDCKSNPERTCIAIQDMDGIYNGQFEIFGSDFVSARMSHDNQYIALVNLSGISVSSSRVLEIYDRSGSLHSSSTLNGLYTQYNHAWLADGRIVYSIQRSLYFTDAYSAEAKNVLTLPDKLEGEEIDSIAVSFDGAKLAIGVDGVPYVLGVDGNGIRKLAIAFSRDTEVNNIAWSPDDQWILLAEGGFRTGVSPSLPGGTKRRFYVVPTEDPGEAFVLSEDDNVRSSEVKLLLQYSVVEENSVLIDITDEAFSESVYWLP